MGWLLDQGLKSATTVGLHQEGVDEVVCCYDSEGLGSLTGVLKGWRNQ